MKFLLHSLQEGCPKDVHEEFNAKELDLEFVDLTYLEGIMLDGTVEKTSDTLIFRGRLKSRVEHTCGRCLKPVEEPVEHPFDMVYEVRGKEEVETLDDLREILILDHPIRYLCREDCRGLCLQCGADLNPGACGCPPSSKDKN